MYCLIADAFELNHESGKKMENKKGSMECMLPEKIY